MRVPTSGAKATELRQFAKGTRSQGLSREELEDMLIRSREVGNEWIRRSVLDGNRIDIFQEHVLGYTLEPHHMAMLRFMMPRPHALLLAFRGSGKSTVCTIGRCAYHIVKNSNIRILLASKSHGNAKGFLREIKTHFERNERLQEIFGNFVGDRKWGEEEIEVRGKTSPHKEATISTVGLGSTVV